MEDYEVFCVEAEEMAVVVDFLPTEMVREEVPVDSVVLVMPTSRIYLPGLTFLRPLSLQLFSFFPLALPSFCSLPPLLFVSFPSFSHQHVPSLSGIPFLFRPFLRQGCSGVVLL
jgi:hypothetical protein